MSEISATTRAALPAFGGESASEPAAPPILPSAIMTTLGLRPRDQFAAWRDMMGSYVEALPPEDAEDGFDARSVAWRLGPFLLNHSRLPPCDLRRTAAQVRRDALDHWVLAICRQGRQRQRNGDVVTEMASGAPYVFSAANAFEATRCGTSMDWIGLYFPRDALPMFNGTPTGATSRPLRGPMADLLGHLLCRLVDRLPSVTTAEAPHLAAAVEALLSGMCVRAAEFDCPHQRGLVMAGRLGQIRRVIRDNLGSAGLSPARLCRLAKVSRSEMYRLFEPFGGVARHIQRERLNFAYRRLADPDERRGIVEIAESVGMFDPSTFSRAFRREFGCAPRDVRSATCAGVPAPPIAVQQHEQNAGASLTAMLRVL